MAEINGGGSIDGVTFESLGLLLTKVDIPLLPTTRQIEEEIPGRDGTIDLETRFGSRQIELTFQVVGTDEAGYHAKLSSIASLFNPLKGVQELKLERTSKRYLVKFNGSIPIERIAQIGEFTVPLKMFNPFPQSVTNAQSTYDLGDGYSLGMGLDLEAETYSFNVTASPTSFIVEHEGNATAKPIIKITGSGSSITISNDTTLESLTYSGALVTGDVLEIDSERMTIELNGVNDFKNFSGVFPNLASGNNTFTITSTSPNFTIEYIFRHTYLY